MPSAAPADDAGRVRMDGTLLAMLDSGPFQSFPVFDSAGQFQLTCLVTHYLCRG